MLLNNKINLNNMEQNIIDSFQDYDILEKNIENVQFEELNILKQKIERFEKMKNAISSIKTNDDNLKIIITLCAWWDNQSARETIVNQIIEYINAIDLNYKSFILENLDKLLKTYQDTEYAKSFKEDNQNDLDMFETRIKYLQVYFKPRMKNNHQTIKVADNWNEFIKNK